MKHYFDNFETPLGKMEVAVEGDAISSIFFVDQTKPTNANSITDLAKSQLQEYFSGERLEFDLPMNAQGIDFHKQVWQALTQIDYGKTCSYSDIAYAINNPKAVRAVGAANGKNPMTIVVPCHRIIGANGSLTGYASGVQRKSWLLNHEAPGLF